MSVDLINHVTVKNEAGSEVTKHELPSLHEQMNKCLPK